MTDPSAPANPTISTSGATTFCNGNAVTLTSSYSSGNVWSNGATSNSIVVTTSGNYSVTHTDAGGCASSSSSVVVTVNPTPATPTITPSGATTFCDGNSVTLASSQGTGNTWSTSETTQNINVTTSGTYTLTYTNTNGCTSSQASITISVNPLPAVNAGTDVSICDGFSTTLSASGATIYTWDNGLGVGGTHTVSPTTTTTYEVTGTDANGCENTDQVTVTVNTMPTVNLGNLETSCINHPAYQLTEGTPSGGTYSGNGIVGNMFDPSIAGVGSHVITYSYVDGNGCSGTATNTLIVDACTSIDDIKGINVHIFPNPTKATITIDIEGEFSYSITDTRGSLLTKGMSNDKTTLDLSDYSFGVYLVEIKNPTTSKLFRIVKQ